MTDFRMNKKKPIGKKTLSSIAGFNVPGKAAPKPVELPPAKPKFEVVKPLIQVDQPLMTEGALPSGLVSPTTIQTPPVEVVGVPSNDVPVLSTDSVINKTDEKFEALKAINNNGPVTEEVTMIGGSKVWRPEVDSNGVELTAEDIEEIDKKIEEANSMGLAMDKETLVKLKNGEVPGLQEFDVSSLVEEIVAEEEAKVVVKKKPAPKKKAPKKEKTAKADGVVKTAIEVPADGTENTLTIEGDKKDDKESM
jgi:hypothetical protein